MPPIKSKKKRKKNTSSKSNLPEINPYLSDSEDEELLQFFKPQISLKFVYLLQLINVFVVKLIKSTFRNIRPN